MKIQEMEIVGAAMLIAMAESAVNEVVEDMPIEDESMKAELQQISERLNKIGNSFKDHVTIESDDE